ncbi:hypothetical protein [Streptomyces malaysiensis]|uniref:hypothetical protein n=1 Tax=Streptomyces malaysiensis TaxID=92644 RepID=UPI0033EC965E
MTAEMVEESAVDPFPYPASAEQQKRWVEAGLNTPGVNAPREALESFAPYIVHPESMLTEPDEGGRPRFKGSVLRQLRTDAGELLIAVVRMHGVGGSVWEHNERISSSWHSLVDPAAPQEGERSLGRIRPYVREMSGGGEEAFAAVESVVASREWLIDNLEKAANELPKRDGHRAYDLQQDLILNGQQDPGLYIAQHICLEEAPLTDMEGKFLHPVDHWHWVAVRGNNRNKRRHDIYGVTSAEVLAGMPVKRIGGDDESIIFDPNKWLPQLSRLFNTEYAKHAAVRDAADPDEVPRAVRAAKVAVVESHLVVGCPTPRRLYRIAQMSNRRDHVHPPLEFTPNDRGRALGRNVMGIYVVEGVLEEKIAEVLSGSAPIAELPDVPVDATVSELRDMRSMLLLRELFPTDRRKRLLIRRALSESPPSQLSAPEVNRRARAWSALTSESYPHPWNPRIAEVFQLADVRDGLNPSRRRLPELLAAADTDDEAFKELIAFRAAHWLAAFDIIDADRGSLTGQKTDDDGTQAARVRRTVKNSLEAMRSHRGKAVGVLRELAAAMDAGDRRPRKVADSGEPLVEPMNRAWFNREFPKASGVRRRKSSAPRKHGHDPHAPGNATLSTGTEEYGSRTEGTTVGQEEVRPLPQAGPGAPAGGPGNAANCAGPSDAASAPGSSAGPAPGSPDAGRSATGSGGSAPGAAESPGDEASGLPALAEQLAKNIQRLSEEVSALHGLRDRLADRAREESAAHPLSRRQADDMGLGVMTAEVGLRRLRPLLDSMSEPL